jgi:Domain of unknown function (DUF5666)
MVRHLEMRPENRDESNSRERKMKEHLLVLTLALTYALLLGTLAFAHGGMDHVVGTITAVTDHSLSVKTRDGAIKTVEFDGETKFVKGDAAATIKDVQVGSRVVIHAHNHDNTLHAAEVQIGTDTAATQH